MKAIHAIGAATGIGVLTGAIGEANRRSDRPLPAVTELANTALGGAAFFLAIAAMRGQTHHAGIVAAGFLTMATAVAGSVVGAAMVSPRQ